MAPPPPPPQLDYWRGFFRGARATIFDAIDAAIRVAAADQPGELRARRDVIAERLYTALIVLPPAEVAAAAATAAEPQLAHQEQYQQLLPEGAGSVPSLCSSDRAGAITDDGAAAAPRRDSDDPVVAEAFRVKAALSNNQEKAEAELLELLRRLQQMEFTVDTMRVTEIGTAVKPLRKHGSKLIRQLVRSLIEGWKAIVNEWVSNGGAAVDHTPQSMDASCLEQEGRLHSPPMDKAALFATPCTSIRLSEFLDEMDDDGNIRINAKEGVPVQCYPANQELVKKEAPMGQWYDPGQNCRLDQSAVRQSRPHEPSDGQTRQQSNAGVQGKPSSAAFGPGRPQKLHFEPRCSEMRPKPQQNILMAQRRPKPAVPIQPSSQPDHAKLEATKRKLQEDYQEFSNAKKQRTIQMVDPQELPKQGNRNIQPSGKPRNSSIRKQLGIHR